MTWKKGKSNIDEFMDVKKIRNGQKLKWSTQKSIMWLERRGNNTTGSV